MDRGLDDNILRHVACFVGDVRDLLVLQRVSTAWRRASAPARDAFSLTRTWIIAISRLNPCLMDTFMHEFRGCHPDSLRSRGASAPDPAPLLLRVARDAMRTRALARETVLAACIDEAPLTLARSALPQAGAPMARALLELAGDLHGRLPVPAPDAAIHAQVQKVVAYLCWSLSHASAVTAAVQSCYASVSSSASPESLGSFEDGLLWLARVRSPWLNTFAVRAGLAVMGVVMYSWLCGMLMPAPSDPSWHLPVWTRVRATAPSGGEPVLNQVRPLLQAVMDVIKDDIRRFTFVEEDWPTRRSLYRPVTQLIDAWLTLQPVGADITAMTEAIETHLGTLSGMDKCLEALRVTINGNFNFTGDRDTYDALSNALIDHALLSRQGLPITLSVIALAVARHAGFTQLMPIGAPGHFLVGIIGESLPTVRLMDVFDNGERLPATWSAGEARTLVPTRQQLWARAFANAARMSDLMNADDLVRLFRMLVLLLQGRITLGSAESHPYVASICEALLPGRHLITAASKPLRWMSAAARAACSSSCRMSTEDLTDTLNRTAEAQMPVLPDASRARALPDLGAVEGGRTASASAAAAAERVVRTVVVSGTVHTAVPVSQTALEAWVGLVPEVELSGPLVAGHLLFNESGMVASTGHFRLQPGMLSDSSTSATAMHCILLNVLRHYDD